MITNSLELAIHRNNTKRFINADKTTITLMPTAPSQMVNGTKKPVAGVARNPQDFKLIWQGDNGIVREISDGEGGVHRFNFVIVGKYDAVVAIGDTWKTGTQKFVVEYVFPDNGYEVKAGGSSHGESPNS